jgi:hypothetical protein
LKKWAKYCQTSLVTTVVVDGNHILAAENVKNYQRVVLKIFEKIFGKNTFLWLSSKGKNTK